MGRVAGFYDAVSDDGLRYLSGSSPLGLAADDPGELRSRLCRAAWAPRPRTSEARTRGIGRKQGQGSMKVSGGAKRE